MLEFDLFYFVENGSYLEFYLMNSVGVVCLIGNSVMINVLINEVLVSLFGIGVLILFVVDIVVCDVLEFEGVIFVLVQDVSVDLIVEFGVVLYVWNLVISVWLKVVEYELMDVEINWDVINGCLMLMLVQIDIVVF